MCRGYHRRNANQWRQTRLLATLQLNAHRPAHALPFVPEEWMPLYGDAPPTPPMDEQEFDETMARLAEFDKL